MKLTARMRVTIGLICLLISLMVLVITIGIGPNQHRAMLKGRSNLAESLAISCIMHLNRRQLDEVDTLIKSCVSRNSEMRSAAIRKKSNKLLVSAGPHDQIWKTNERSSSQVALPLIVGNREWGNLEICFASDDPQSIIGWARVPWARYILMTMGLGFFVVYFYLGIVLKQLDPSRVVPKSVRVALDTIAEGLILTDRKGRVAIANQAFAGWAGRDPDSFIGAHADKMPWQPADDQKLPWIEAMETRKPQVRTLQLVDSEDNVRSLIANSAPILGPDGSYRGVLTSFEDVSELEEHKRELSEAKNAADQANRAKSEFLARMSHEIRTPMNAILGFTEVLQEGNLSSSEEGNRYLQTIQHSGEHLLSLINDILDLSKVESGQMDLEIRPTPMVQLMRHVVSVLSIKASEKNIRLDLGSSGKVPVQIMTDELRLKQTLINLVGNAIKFTDEGGVALVARVENQNGKTMFCIDIGDTGIGMTPEQCERIFDPFQQADTSITRKYGGTGLGLAISKQFVEKMGGEITVKSTPGVGSVFTISLDPGDLTNVPFAYVDDETVSQFVDNDRKRVQQTRFDNARVLVVDDSESNRELIALLLRRSHAQVDFAENGEQAIEKVVHGDFDVVLMDMQMPVMDGFTATRTLRSMGIQVPIVACTANAMRQDEIECEEAGCNGFLPKPINQERLFACIGQFVNATESSESEMPLTHAHPAHTESNSIPKTDSTLLARSTTPATSTPSSPENLESNAMTQQTETELPELVSDFPYEDDDFRVVIELFALRLREKFTLMETAATAGDFNELASLAHWLKGSGGTAGFHQFTEPARNLELAAKSESQPDVETTLEVVRSLVQRVRVKVSEQTLEFA